MSNKRFCFEEESSRYSYTYKIFDTKMASQSEDEIGFQIIDKIEVSEKLGLP